VRFGGPIAPTLRGTRALTTAGLQATLACGEMNREIDEIASLRRSGEVRKIALVPEASMPDLTFLGGFQ
jgi:hypothetical protein